MNTFLIIYLIILISEAIISTILKYTWQAEEKWDEPWYNQKTEHQRNSSKVSYGILDFAVKETLFFGTVTDLVVTSDRSDHCDLLKPLLLKGDKKTV